MPRRPIDITIQDLSGTRAVVTGASDGIGLEIAARLAAAGAQVVLPVRNAAKGEAAVREIDRRAPGADVSLRPLDLGALASVAAFTATMVDEALPIHLLISNAGVMTPPSRQETQDGFELQLGTNHLGHAALVLGLLPLLRAGQARVVSQISVAANSNAMHWDDPNWEQSYDGMKAYSQSKIALGLFGLELGRRSRAQGWGITSNLAHPGVAPTGLLAARPEMGRPDDTRSVKLIRALSARGILVGTPASAALPALLAATAPAATGETMYGPSSLGHLGGRPAEQKLYRRLRSADDAERVWELSERLIGGRSVRA